MSNISRKEKLNFKESIELYNNTNHERYNIGTYNEKTLHRILKHFFEPNKEFHEVKIGNYVADIKKGNFITEIQTRAIYRMKNKFNEFLPEYSVNVVFPIYEKKTIYKIDSESGEIVSKRRSPKKETPDKLIQELCYIKNYLSNENLIFTLLLLDVDEFRFSDKTIKIGRKSTTKYNIVPTSLNSILKFSSKKDYLYFLPKNLSSPFTVEQLSKVLKKSRSYCSSLVYVLSNIGTINKCGKKGNAYLYEIIN